MKGKHLFIVDTQTFDSLDDDAVRDTVADLKELNLYFLPYDRLSVRMPTERCVVISPGETMEPLIFSKGKTGGELHYERNERGQLVPKGIGPSHWVELRNLNLKGEPVEYWAVNEGLDPRWNPYEIRIDRDDGFDRDHTAIVDMLIVLLATKNTRKSVKHNSLAKHGIGAKKPGSTRAYEYVTTISIPQDLPDDEDHPPTGREVCPHLRRGHIRRQHYGPRNSFIRQVWIAPCFVNADKGFVDNRRAYNVTL